MKHKSEGEKEWVFDSVDGTNKWTDRGSDGLTFDGGVIDFAHLFRFPSWRNGDLKNSKLDENDDEKC